MFVSPTIRTSSGIRLLTERPMVTVRLTERETELLAHALRQEAEDALADGNVGAFDRLHVRATAILEGGRLVSNRFRHLLEPRRAVSGGVMSIPAGSPGRYRPLGRHEVAKRPTAELREVGQ